MAARVAKKPNVAAAIQVRAMSVQWADVTHNVAPMRAAPENGSEQVSQAIAGDPVELIESRGGFARVRMVDGYEGWALEIHLRRCSSSDRFCFRSPTSELRCVWTPFADLVSPDGDPVTRLAYGTPLRVADASGTGTLVAVESAGNMGLVEGSTLGPFGARWVSTEPICAVARSFLGTPYLWGGTTPFGFDCSGLVQRVYSSAGIVLPRDAYLQAASPLGEPLPDGAPLRAGDLVFFCGARDPRNRGITHVGMMIDGSLMIHASGKRGVTIQPREDPEILADYSTRGAWRTGLWV